MKGSIMIDSALPTRLTGENLSRIITGACGASIGRSAIATGSPAATGYLATSCKTTGLQPSGLTAAATIVTPLIVSEPVLLGGIAPICNLFC